eukprot:gene10021-18937_t
MEDVELKDKKTRKNKSVLGLTPFQYLEWAMDRKEDMKGDGSPRRKLTR